ncbi:hypothetical protein V8D89_005821 [Ganoderma adspersum]
MTIPLELHPQPPDTFKSDMGASTNHTKPEAATDTDNHTPHTHAGRESNVSIEHGGDIVRTTHPGDTAQNNQSRVESKNGDGNDRDGTSVETVMSPTMNLDLATSIPDLYRVLDLIYDRGSGGLVDKIIIEQESLGRLINVLRPNAYTSITKVDFSALDHVQLRVIGLYGSKSAIVDFLRQKAIVDEETALAMLQPMDTSINSTQPTLRSGMYLHMRGGEDITHVIYWPEDTTWDDNCVSSVSKNRVTFMRYLTKICDQVVCLMSDEHAKAIVWRRNDEDSDQESDDDEDGGAGRLFAFEVSKTNEQEEGVTVHPGFEQCAQLYFSSSRHLRPRLVRGEMEQGIITAQYVEEQRKVRHETETINEFRLKNILVWTYHIDRQTHAIRLSESLPTDALEILFNMKCPFKPSVQDAIARYRGSVSDVKKNAADKLTKDLNEMVDRLDMDGGQLLASVTELLTSQVMAKFPCLSIAAYPAKPRPDHLHSLCDLFEGVARLIHEAPKIYKLNVVTPDRYKTLKERILTLDYLLSAETGLTEQDRRELVTTTLRDGYDKPPKSGTRWLINASKKVVAFAIGADSSTSRAVDVPEQIVDVDDHDFLSRIPDIPGTEVAELARKHFSNNIKREAQDLSRKIRKIQRDTCREQITRESQINEKDRLEDLRVGMLSVLRIKTANEMFTEPEVRYTLHPLELRQEDAHRMREDTSHIPLPQLRSHSSTSFTLSADTYIAYAHLLPQSRILLVTRDHAGEGRVYVSSVTSLRSALQGKRPLKELKRDKIGENFMLAYDETKRVLAVCGGMSNVGRDSRLQLHTFIFDETYSSLQGMGTPVNLSPWYDADGVTIKHMEFVSGIEELLFVDNFCRARIFSLVTQQFRPATLQLPSRPSSIHSTPDGSCFFAIDEPTEYADIVALRAYHWTSFGSSEGIKVDVPKTVLGDCIVTSLQSRENVYLVGVDLADSMLRSVAFKITRRMTAFTFKEKGVPTTGRKEQMTSHNSLVDCHMDIWTRFPVVPAVRRETLVSALRERKSRIFVLNVDSTPVERHFSTLISEFKRITHKPVGDELKSIHVRALSHTAFLRRYPPDLSTFCAGEWLVELICLIPIHIAITRDNRFLPLKDGVWSPEVERSLLGAEVAKIVDSISFGWYESLFQSYMATKPVKVVSSMGEQSVGKSFALNHLVDTSFAGSAMRTTEGVWMSVAPTDQALIVALDFEGVHSIERSAQEDSLLVLFNTAISNLVLFRNNFAFSRDITGLFQSFQSSASVLDPEANPMLFQSTLVIIIKDVAPHDTNDIKKEFHLKFQQIVQAEQAMNFISRLHRDRVDIVPWPLLGSKQFYTLFKAIKKSLDEQAVTHHGGAIFLQTMKTLMAKLKINDWGAMSQTLAAHRVHLLLSLLSKALAFGATEIIPDYEPLVDFDTASVLDIHDTSSRFYLGETGPQGQPASRDVALQELCQSCTTYGDRFSQADTDWKQGLQTFLDGTVDTRAEHVRAWINVNTSKFGSAQSEVQQLFRTFDSAVIDLKASVRLCGSQCGLCNLSCILGRHHEGSHSCQTDHRCVHMCQFEGAEHGKTEPCGLPAGHPGTHLCDVTAHLCGQRCKLVGQKGCQAACVKMVDHEDGDHMCSASTHECGMRCSLTSVRLSDGRTFSCDGQCRISSDVPHSDHRCDNTQCPIDCQLCKRLCSDHDHLHGLQSGAAHLCGQEHACSAICQAGICQIDTAPQSVEATFTGRHESFQYTKVLSKRLPCVIAIPAGQVSHTGKHSHDMGPNPFHYCEERCPDCGYFCTLPLGHSQQEHDTSHGSMSKTKWAVDGGERTVLEVGGRKFGVNDDGAPMLCSMYCRSMGRHAHIGWCRTDDPANCGGPEHEHIAAPMQPNPRKPKDWIAHGLYWRRTGFLDPYSQEDQANFAKCDRMCIGPEHDSATHPRAQPSYCTLPILHRRQPLDQVPANGLGYVSNDGHAFECRNPAVLRQAFHVIFAIDRSGSMDYSNCGLPGQT